MVDAVVVKDLTKRFGSFTAVDAISFSVPQGEIFGFLGANGAGKTTTIRILCGLLMPTNGSAMIAGYDVYTQVDAIKRTIGYMSQKFSLYNDLTVVENIAFYARVYGLPEVRIRQKIIEMVRALELLGQEDTLVADLPLGWKQRLALSTALVHDPDIIFLDEPTSGVDPVSREHFWQLIRGLAAQGKTIFVTTHYMDEAEYCDRISIMQDGRIIELDSPQALREKYAARSMHEVFMLSVKRKERA